MCSAAAWPALADWTSGPSIPVESQETSMRILVALAALAALAVPALAQRPSQSVVPTAFDPRSSSALRFRYIGPVGNRVSAVVGVPGDPLVYYAGAASGGIFKTTDGGLTWASI